MRVALAADVHIANFKTMGGELEGGINRRCRLVLDALRRAVTVAVQEGAGRFFILGDLFDTDTPSPAIIAAAIDALRHPDIQIEIIPGNHDVTSSAVGHSALAPLRRAGIGVVDEAALVVVKTIAEFLFVPYEPGKVAEWFPRRVEQLAAVEAQAPRVLLAHAGLADAAMAPWLQTAGVSVDVVGDLIRKHGIQFCATGDFHQRREWYRNDSGMWGRGNGGFGDGTLRWPRLLQVGALVPCDFGDQPPHGSITILDLDKWTLKEIEIPGPRFITVTDREPLLIPKDGNTYFLRVQSDVKNRDASTAMIQDAKARGHVADGRVDVDRTEIKAQAATAAKNASSAISTEGAIDDYVRSMPIEDGVDRDVVTQLVKGYLR